MWDATKRLIDDIDIAVGVPARLVGATKRVDDAAAGDLVGSVAGLLADGIETWLQVLLDRSRVVELVLVLPADATAPWFTTLAAAECSLCLLCHPAPPRLRRMVAYNGERRHGFWLAFRELGGVLKGERY